MIQSLKSLGEDSGIAITVASYLTPKGNNIQGRGITPDKVLDIPDSAEYGNAEDKWIRNAEIFLDSVLEKNEVSKNINNLGSENLEA